MILLMLEEQLYFLSDVHAASQMNEALFRSSVLFIVSLLVTSLPLKADLNRLSAIDSLVSPLIH